MEQVFLLHSTLMISLASLKDFNMICW